RPWTSTPRRPSTQDSTRLPSRQTAGFMDEFQALANKLENLHEDGLSVGSRTPSDQGEMSALQLQQRAEHERAEQKLQLLQLQAEEEEAAERLEQLRQELENEPW
ncbi:unnamed protein product, partial [Effrenium voratum]